MSAGDLAAVVVVIVSVAAVCALLVTLWALLRVVDQMRRSVDELRDEAMPAVQELRRVVGVVDDDLVRVEGPARLRGGRGRRGGVRRRDGRYRVPSGARARRRSVRPDRGDVPEASVEVSDVCAGAGGPRSSSTP